MNEFRSDSASNLPELRNPFGELFQALHDGPDYSTQTMKTQIIVWFGDKRVGAHMRPLALLHFQGFCAKLRIG